MSYLKLTITCWVITYFQLEIHKQKDQATAAKLNALSKTLAVITAMASKNVSIQ